MSLPINISHFYICTHFNLNTFLSFIINIIKVVINIIPAKRLFFPAIDSGPLVSAALRCLYVDTFL